MENPSESTGLLSQRFESEGDGSLSSDGDHSDRLASLMNIDSNGDDEIVPIDIDEMKLVTHNDPTISDLIEDVSKLRGSTRMMINR